MVENGNKNCPKCHGTGMVKEKNGSCHVCYDCLASGNLDQHDKKIKDAKDFGIKL